MKMVVIADLQLFILFLRFMSLFFVTMQNYGIKNP